MELWQWLGELHPKLVQFPLVLLLVGLLFDAAGSLARGRPWAGRAHWAGMATTALGTLGLLFAFICGIYAEIWAGRAGVPQHPIELHELMANIASWGFVLLLAWRIFLVETPATVLRPQKPRNMRVYVVLGLCWYGLLALTGWLGGQLVFHYGAGVTGARADTLLTMSDLNVLATRQTDLNLRYSEWMHHVFGWMTLGLAASLLVQAVRPHAAKRITWIVPAFLLAGGVFLFFFADLDLYRLTDWRQLRDREVQLHKSLALIMGTIGAVGLWRLKRRRAEKGAGEVAAVDAAPKASNSKLVAVLALIGGAMLFTHVHTVAPYANVAAGVYIAHVVLGLVALGIGVTRLTQDWLTGAWARRTLALVFGGLMAVEAVLLITYNEGLPWYIGYGRYDRQGPTADITVAPFGDFRALLYVNTQTGDAFVGFRTRFAKEIGADDSVTLALDGPPLLVLAQGYREIALPLTRGTAGGETVASIAAFTGSNFRTHADFLTKATHLNAKLILRHKGRRLVGYFDPWVTPLLTAVPPNELAKFECPMHEGIRQVEGGACPLCGMALQAIRAPRQAGELHDSAYALTATVAKGIGLTAEMVLQPTQNGAPLKTLAVVHEQPMHLIVVSEDLTYFDHVHPVEAGGAGGEGVYRWNYTFPAAGRYLLYVDLTPTGDRAQFFRVPLVAEDAGVRVAVEQTPATRLVVDEAATVLTASIAAGKSPQDSAAWRAPRAAAPADTQVQLISQPRTLTAGLHATLLFRLADAQGRPITDVSPYLGAMGHCAIISEDGSTFLHSHPEQIFPLAPRDRGGPDIAFHTLFPKAGRYRIWAQFKRPGDADATAVGPIAGAADRLVIASFTVEVKDSLVPPSILNFLLGD